MWQIWILILCATGISSGSYDNDFQTNNIHSLSISQGKNRKNSDGIKRFACPVGFFRLKKNCYYLSAGVAQWKDAYYHCRDINSTLAVLDKNGKDRLLRKYMMGDQFTKFERWIGGVYNWRQMSWKWGESGKKIEFEHFAKSQDTAFKNKHPDEYAWHCIVIDPTVEYRWNPRSCVQQKHYICEVPAGRIGRKRKETIDSSLEPQKLKLKPRKKDNKKYRKQKSNEKEYDQNDVQSLGQKKWSQTNINKKRTDINLGLKPVLQEKSLPKIKRTRHRSNRREHRNKSQKTPQTMQKPTSNYVSFLGGGPANEYPQQLADDNILQQFQANINDLTLEEVLLKT